MDLDAVRAALRAHDPAALLELSEGQWLDAKGAPYELRDPRAVEELAKDVAAFANGGGGILVIGRDELGGRDGYCRPGDHADDGTEL